MGDKSSFDPLRPFAGYQAIIEYVRDAEARRAARNLAESLAQAGWKVPRLAPVDDPNINDGVDVQPFEGPIDGSGFLDHTRSNEAAELVVDFLHSWNWQARTGFLLDEKGLVIHDPKVVPPDALRIRVGLYPPVTYVSPPAMKGWAAHVAQRQQEMEKERTQMKEKEEDYLKHFAPQVREQVRASREESAKREQIENERIFGPCKPLEPIVPRP